VAPHGFRGERAGRENLERTGRGRGSIVAQVGVSGGMVYRYGDKRRGSLVWLSSRLCRSLSESVGVCRSLLECRSSVESVGYVVVCRVCRYVDMSGFVESVYDILDKS